MKVSFLLFQRNYKIKFFASLYNSHLNDKELSSKPYQEFMKWCYSKKAKQQAKIFCKIIGVSKVNMKSMIKMLNLLVFSRFHPILFENNRTKEIEKLSRKLCELRNMFFDKSLYCSMLHNKFRTFQKEKVILLQLLLDWNKCVKEWKEIDKYMLVQDCIVHYVELINLNEQLEENDKNDNTEKEKELNKLTRNRIIVEKRKCKDRIEEIDGIRGLRVMKGVLEHISNWERNEKKLQKQIKMQMEKAFWDCIRKDIESETFQLCQIHIKELIEECGSLFHNNVELLDKLVENVDLDFMKSRCASKTTDARYWYSIFIPFVQFLQECDARQNQQIYETKIDELYLWTGQLTFDRFHHMFSWIKYRVNDILERKRAFESTNAYIDWKRDRNL